MGENTQGTKAKEPTYGDSHTMPWVCSAYDEYTEEAWDGEPHFHARAREEAQNCRHAVREMGILIPQSAVLALFAQRVPSVRGEVSEVKP